MCIEYSLCGHDRSQAAETGAVPTNVLTAREASLGDALEIMLDHTAHHRGALVAYARILGMEPQIPYFEMKALEERLEARTSQAHRLKDAPTCKLYA
jgi:uncharacterized damage-inducible protein DinB